MTFNKQQHDAAAAAAAAERPQTEDGPPCRCGLLTQKSCDGGTGNEKAPGLRQLVDAAASVCQTLSSVLSLSPTPTPAPLPVHFLCSAAGLDASNQASTHELTIPNDVSALSLWIYCLPLVCVSACLWWIYSSGSE